MKITEIILDRLNDTKLFEMAFERKRLLQKISERQEQISDHIVKYYAFNDRSRLHWAKELNTQFGYVNRLILKGGKKPSAETYYHLLFVEPFGHGVTSVRDIIGMFEKDPEYNTVKRTMLSEYEILEQIEKVMHRISHDISISNFDTIHDYL